MNHCLWANVFKDCDCGASCGVSTFSAVCGHFSSIISWGSVLPGRHARPSAGCKVRYVQKEMQYSAGISHCRECIGVALFPSLSSIPPPSAYSFCTILATLPVHGCIHSKHAFHIIIPLYYALFCIFHTIPLCTLHLCTNSSILIYMRKYYCMIRARVVHVWQAFPYGIAFGYRKKPSTKHSKYLTICIGLW